MSRQLEKTNPFPPTQTRPRACLLPLQIFLIRRDVRLMLLQRIGKLVPARPIRLRHEVEVRR